MFSNPELEAAFERDGYVVVDLLDAKGVEQLLSSYRALKHQHLDEFPWVEGFEISLYNPDRSYRTRVLADIEGHLLPALDTHLVQHRIAIANYFVKAPLGQSIPLHADWAFVDEAQFRSATVWCPLTDATTEQKNGALGVVVGSHHRIDFPRVANVASFDRCEQASDGLDRRIVDLRAGQAVIVDSRAVHFSPPNESGSERVVAACVVAPVEAALHHYWMDETGQLVRFELDRSFYLSYEIGTPASADGILDRVPVTSGAQRAR